MGETLVPVRDEGLLSARYAEETRLSVYRLAVATAGMLLIVAIGIFFQPLLDHQNHYLPFLIAILFAAWYGGIITGTITLALGALAANFLGSSRDPLSFQDGWDVLSLLIYLLIGGFIVVFVQRHKQAYLWAVRRQQELAESEAYFRSVLSKSPVIVASADRDLRYTWIYNPHEAFDPMVSVGKRDDELVPYEAVAELIALKRGVLESCARMRSEVAINVEGERFVYDIAAEPVVDANGQVSGVRTVAVDITERKQVEHRILILQKLASALAVSLTPTEVADTILQEGILSLGVSAGTVVELTDNGKMLKLVSAVGYHENDVEAWRYFPVDLDSLPVAIAVRTKQAIWLGSRREVEARLPKPTFERQDAHYEAWAAIPLIVDGEAVGAIGLRFATEQAFAEKERAFILSLASLCGQALARSHLYEAEKRARHGAEIANETKLRFLAIVSHELRNPLAVIKGFASTLLATDVSWDAETQHEYLMTIDEESDKLNELIEQLLDLSRLQAGTLKVNPAYISLREVLDQALLELQLLTTNHKLTLSCPDDLPPVFIDRARIIQVITNLVQNAVKYTPPQTPIRVVASLQGKWVRVEVDDQGPGIPPEQHEVIFEPFRQLEGGKKGLGLGLAICKGVVSTHGGEIWIEDKPEAGTCIAFTLPTLNSHN